MRYITGHKNADVDSYVSVCLLERILNWMGIEVQGIILDLELDKITEYFINKYSLPKLKKKETEEIGWESWYLVDHNNPIESIGVSNSGRVKGIIDHHTDTLQCFNVCDFRIVKKSGSAAQLVMKYGVEKGYPITDEEKLWVVLALMVDTVGLRSSKATKEDKDFAMQICKDLGLNYKDFCEETVVETDWDVPVEQLAKNGYKVHSFKGNCFSSSYVELKGKTPEKMRKLQELYIYLRKNHDYMFHFVLVVDFEKNKSEVRFIGGVPTGVFVEYYDHIVSRGATVLPFVYSLL